MSIQDAYAPPKNKPNSVRNQRGSSIREPLTQKILQAQCRAFFDKGYYLKTYPDVKQSKLTPFDHYMKMGWKELKNPSPKFDTKLYVTLYPHLRDVNHLMYYLRQGKYAGQIIQPRKVIPLKNPKYYLCAVSMFRDEARFLKEWLEYHLMLGVEHFYLTNHLSKDNYREILQPYVDRGLVTLRQEKRNRPGNQYLPLQYETYNRAINALRKNTEWLLVFDTDEFAFPYTKKNIPEVLRQYDDCASVCFNWKMFGTSNIKRLNEGELLTEKMVLTSKSPPRNHCKSFVKPRYVEHMSGPHFPALKPGFLAVDPDKARLDSKKTTVLSRECMKREEGMHFYHYAMRDQAFLLNVKCPRLYEASYYEEYAQQDAQMNEVEDTSMHRFVPALKKRMGLTSEETDPLPASNEEIS